MKLFNNLTFWWPVRVSLPGEGGEPVAQTFDAKFRYLTTSQLEALKVRVLADNVSDTELAAELIVGWRGVLHVDGSDVPFSRKELTRLLEVPTIGSAICQAFIASMQPVPQLQTTVGALPAAPFATRYGNRRDGAQQ